MPDLFTSSGRFGVTDGEVDQFVERWTALITWTREHHPGLREARLAQDDADPHRFVSYAVWDSSAQRASWRADPGYHERSAACREVCDDYRAGDYHEVRALRDDVRDGSHT